MNRTASDRAFAFGHSVEWLGHDGIRTALAGALSARVQRAWKRVASAVRPGKMESTRCASSCCA